MKKKIFKINKEKQEQKPKKLFLMITVLERGKSQKFIPILEKHDVVVQMTMLGKGTASSEILNYLGLAENEKDILFSLVKEDKIHPEDKWKMVGFCNGEVRNSIEIRYVEGEGLISRKNLNSVYLPKSLNEESVLLGSIRDVTIERRREATAGRSAERSTHKAL